MFLFLSILSSAWTTGTCPQRSSPPSLSAQRPAPDTAQRSTSLTPVRRASCWRFGPWTSGVLRQRALHATVRCLTVANTLSIGSKFASGPNDRRKVEERQQRLTILDQTFDGLVVFGAYFSAKVVNAASAAPRFGDSQISRRSLCALVHRLRSLSSTFNVLCSQHR